MEEGHPAADPAAEDGAGEPKVAGWVEDMNLKKANYTQLQIKNVNIFAQFFLNKDFCTVFEVATYSLQQTLCLSEKKFNWIRIADAHTT